MIEDIIIISSFIIGFVIIRFTNWQKLLPDKIENWLYSKGFKQV